jgi:uncharacterized membrane protein
MTSLKLYLIVTTVFLAIDAVWIGVLMKGFYDLELGPLARRENGALSPRWGAAIVVYLVIPLGLVLFVRPAMGAGATSGQAFGWGAVFGLIVYGVYDLTNRATLEHWSLRLTVVDMLWGATICGVAAVVLRLADRGLSF